MAVSFSWLLLVLLTGLELVLFQQVFVNQLADVINLQALETGVVGWSRGSTFFLHLLSIVNLLACLASLTSTYATSTSSRSKWRVRQVCSNQWRLVQAGIMYWFALKITFASCLLISIGSRVISSEDREGDEKRLLLIVASSTIFLLVVHRLAKDLAILSTAAQDDLQSGRVAYSLLSSEAGEAPDHI